MEASHDNHEHKTYFGCRLVQRVDDQAAAFFVFYARVRDVMNWAGIERVTESAKGTQRVLREARHKAITRFFESSPINTIPSNVLLAFDTGVTSYTSFNEQLISCALPFNINNGCNEQLDWGFLEFDAYPNTPHHLRPALIVDGQHRLNGMQNYLQEDLPILVVCILDADIEEQAFQFIVINDKAVRVQTSNVKSIIAHLDTEEERLQARLLAAGIRYGDKSPLLRDINDLPSSPFQHLIDWDYNKTGTKLVQTTTIEQSISYFKKVFNFLDEDEGTLFELFCATWRAVKQNYPDIWGKRNNFMTKVNINAMSEFLCDSIKKAWEFGLVDVYSSNEVERQVLSILRFIPQVYWETEWNNIKVQDNANVRSIIKADISILIENYKLRNPWYEDLRILSMNSD